MGSSRPSQPWFLGICVSTLLSECDASVERQDSYLRLTFVLHPDFETWPLHMWEIPLDSPLALCSVASPQNTGRNCHQKWASEYIPYTELQTPQLLTQWFNLWLLNFHANLSFTNESEIMTVNSMRKRACLFSTPFYLWARRLAHCSKPEVGNKGIRTV